MIDNELKVKLIDAKIEDNINILLASFGLYGIVHSKLKFKKIMEILDELSGDLAANISLFFEELEYYYARDVQFKHFPIHELQRMISEERGYVLAKILK